MTHAPCTPPDHGRPGRPPRLVPHAPPLPHPRPRLHDELRSVLAGAHGLDDAELAARGTRAVATVPALDLLGPVPVRTGTETLARLDALVGELVARMRDARWDPVAAPCAVTSVLAASVPAVEAVLLREADERAERAARAARPGRGRRRPTRTTGPRGDR